MNNIGKKTGNEIKMYGHYYKVFNRDCGMPSRITVVGINGGNVTFVYGHLPEEELKSCKIKMICSKKKILTELNEEQKKHIELQDMEEKRNEIKIHGHYFKIFKGYYGMPSEVTIVGINGEDVTFVRGHLSEEELEGCMLTMTCNKKQIITKLNDRQRKYLELQDIKNKKREELVHKIFVEFNIRIPFLSWASMELSELEEYYEELKTEEYYEKYYKELKTNQ